MRMKHVLLELYCDCDIKNEKEKPKYCCDFGDTCFEHNCQYLSYTYCPNEIAFAGASGVVESFDDCIGFGGDMEPEPYDENEVEILLNEWKSICKKKIDEAYDEYIEFKNSRIINGGQRD